MDSLSLLSPAAATKEGESTSAFKQKLTHHKRWGNDPNRINDLVDVIDASLLLLPSNHANNRENDRLYPVDMSAVVAAENGSIDDCLYYDGPWFAIRGFPGCYLAPQAIDETLQLELAYRAVSEWCEAPHRTNMDLQLKSITERINGLNQSMWTLWKEQRQNVQRSARKKHKSNSYHSNVVKGAFGPTKYYRSFQKLSWATLGYHYNWTKRSYSPDEKSPMPWLLEQVSKRFARTALLLEQSADNKDKTKNHSLAFYPTASIVNYYNVKSVMGGHQDDLELALDKPIVSISLGLPAIFLLGGKSKEENPVVAILLRPGDVFCMGGGCRLNFHAMARVLPKEAASKIALPNVDPTHQRVMWRSLGAELDGNISKEEAQEVRDYLLVHRININVRQVYPDNYSYENTN